MFFTVAGEAATSVVSTYTVVYKILRYISPTDVGASPISVGATAWQALISLQYVGTLPPSGGTLPSGVGNPPTGVGATAWQAFIFLQV